MFRLAAGLAFVSVLSVPARAIVAPADTTPPTVNITLPTAGTVFNYPASVNLNFQSQDDVGVASQNIQLAVDGVNFNTTIASGLPGSTLVFFFQIPPVNTTQAAIRVQAVDAAGNIGSATVGSLTFVNDSVPPSVTVTSPQAKDKYRGGEPIPVSFNSSDNIAVVSHEIQLSVDGGGSFQTLATGLPGNIASYTLTAPDAKEKDAVVRVIARDAAGNAGQGSSAPFKLKADNKD